MVKIDDDDSKQKDHSTAMLKTTFTVAGICCASEAKLIGDILNPIEGVENLSVNIVAKTTTVVHDPSKISASQIVSILNEAHLKSEIKEFGKAEKKQKSWPSANVIASGVLLLISTFSFIFPPLKWIALASIALGIFGIFQRAIAALARYTLDVNVLMVTAVIGAVALGDYNEGASIVFLYSIAEWLEAKSTSKARASLESLLNMAPRTAVIAETGEILDVKNVVISTVVSVKAGEFVPLDGVVVAGASAIDESSLTGEFMPVDKVIGSNVWAGTVVLTGFINVMTTALEKNSSIARMVQLVDDAQNQRSNAEEVIEKFTKYYTPGVVLLAALTAIIPLLFNIQPINQWIYLALVLLVIACPCALVISTPVAKVCGLSAAANIGLVFKGGNHLENLAKIKAMAFDKTGTLTEGAFKVVEMQLLEPDINVNKFLYWVSSLESKSNHPVGKALVEYSRVHQVEPTGEVNDFNMILGGGISGFVDDCYLQIGNANLALKNGWLRENELCHSEAGITVCYVGMNNRFLGYFTLGDKIREEAAQAIQKLQKQGIQVTVLTGDSKAAVKLIQQQIGENIEVEANLSPEGKMKKIAGIKVKHGRIAMVGDGINDAPALAASDLGIAMGVSGSAVATETANVVLMSNDLRKIPEAVELSRTSLAKIYQNITMSIVVKLLFFGLAFGGFPSLWAAVVADMGTCLLVIWNSMLLLYKYGKKKTRSISACKVPELCITIDLSSSSNQELKDDPDELLEPLLPTIEETEKTPCSCCRSSTNESNPVVQNGV